MLKNTSLTNTKAHLKEITFQTMINQKHYNVQNQLGKIIHDEMLSLWIKKLDSSAKYFSRMTNEDVDPKVMYFFRMLLLIQNIVSNHYYL